MKPYTLWHDDNNSDVHFEDALGQSLNGLVPVAVRRSLQRTKHDRQKHRRAGLRQYVCTERLGVPEVQCALGDLEVVGRDAIGQQLVQLVLNGRDLLAADQLQHLLELVEVENL